MQIIYLVLLHKNLLCKLIEKFFKNKYNDIYGRFGYKQVRRIKKEGSRQT